jgi:serine/threonine-protein kinase RsbW
MNNKKPKDDALSALLITHHSSFFSTTFHSSLSSLEEVDDVCRESRTLLESQGWIDHCFALDMLLREFLNNAILHGHRSDIGKQVQVKLRIGRKWIVVQVADEGPGFDWQSINLSHPSENATSGRGLLIGTWYSHRMRFNRSGNQVTLWIRKAE